MIERLELAVRGFFRAPRLPELVLVVPGAGHRLPERHPEHLFRLLLAQLQGPNILSDHLGGRVG